MCDNQTHGRGRTADAPWGTLSFMRTPLACLLLLLLTSPVLAGFDERPDRQEASITDRIKAQRAKEAEDLRQLGSSRPWDRDADGKRPWQVTSPSLATTGQAPPSKTP